MQVADVAAFANDLTHPKITEKAVERSVLAGDYFAINGKYVRTAVAAAKTVEKTWVNTVCGPGKEGAA